MKSHRIGFKGRSRIDRRQIGGLRRSRRINSIFKSRIAGGSRAYQMNTKYPCRFSARSDNSGCC